MLFCPLGLTHTSSAPTKPGKTLRLPWPRVWRLKLYSGSGRQIWGAEPLRPCYRFLLRVSR